MTVIVRGTNGQFEQKAEHQVGRENEDEITTDFASSKPPKLRKCRVYVRDRTAEALPNIVAKLIEQAEAGSIAHLTLLLKAAGLDAKGNSAPKSTRRKGKGLAEILKEQWEADAAKLAAMEQQKLDTVGE